MAGRLRSIVEDLDRLTDDLAGRQIDMPSRNSPVSVRRVIQEVQKLSGWQDLYSSAVINATVNSIQLENAIYFLPY